jgi:hypothetical protein
MRHLIGALVLAASLLVWGGCRGAEQAEDAPASFPVGRQATAKPIRVHAHIDGVPIYRRDIFSPVYHVDRIYSSMRGPMSNLKFRLHDRKPELVWVTGFRADMMSADGVLPVSAEFMCHSSLELDGVEYMNRFRSELGLTSNRLFTASQGQLSLELPPGFGIPMLSDTLLTLNTQVLNHNLPDADIEVRHRVSVDFVLDRDLTTPMKPLLQRGVYAMKVVDGQGRHYGLASHEVEDQKHGEGCLPGEDASGSQSHVESDPLGREFTGFWVVPPGREVNHTRVTPKLRLPHDTTVHAIAVHLHPFAESLALRDLTTDEILFESRARQTGEGIGLSRVETFISEEGFRLYADHEYELVSVYDNTSGRDQDSMAVMYMYVLAPDLHSGDLKGTTTAQIPLAP